MRKPLHLHLDVVGGVAGDMFVAAMADAFPDLRDRVLRDVRAVVPASKGSAAFEEGKSGAIRALRFGLSEGPASGGPTGNGAGHRPAAGHVHEHDHPGGRRIRQGPPGEPASYREIAALIEDAGAPPKAREHALRILRLLAETEARIHDVPIEAVHFHEIAAWDSIMDVVAAGAILDWVGEASWSVSELPLGGGMIKTQHGLLPAPAPATASLLQGFRWRDDGLGGERVTPTGAAILRYVVSDPAAPPAGGRLAASGTGAGTRRLEGMPNVLRVLAFDASTGRDADMVASLSFEVDDMTGEEVGVACDRLRAADCLIDVTTSMRSGKKNRPMVAFHLLCEPGRLEEAQRVVFSETSTIGLRWRLEQRARLARREFAVAEEPAVRVKEVARPGGAATRKAESDDLREHAGLERRRALKRRAERSGGA